MYLTNEERAEIYSWLFITKEWPKLPRQPIQDKGFEDSFRDYIYSKIKPDIMSHKGDMGLGLGYFSFSTVSHELDTIFSKGAEKFIFELKHYSTGSNISKELISDFLFKVMDFYLKNAFNLSEFRIIMYFVTTNDKINDSIRKICLGYGIRLIEPTFMTPKILNYFARDLYQKIPETSLLRSEAEQLIEKIDKLIDQCDYSFTDIFIYENGEVKIDKEFLNLDIGKIFNEIKECNITFNELYQKWKHYKN